MTQKEFNEEPLLMAEKRAVAATGYSRNTLRKMVDCKVLKLVRPAGCGQGKYQKLQIAKLIGLDA